MMIELKKANTDAVKQARRLYREAFPRNERFSFRLLVKRSIQGRADFWYLTTNRKPVGMAYVLPKKGLAYILYLAITGSERGHGYGAEAMEAIQKHYAGCRLFLAVEKMDRSAANFEQRVRRRNFYLRCGLSYIPYQIKEASVVFDVMSIGGMVNPDEYNRLTENWLGWPLKRLIDMRMFLMRRPMGEAQTDN